MKKVSAIVVNYNSADLSMKLIKSLRAKEIEVDWEIILLDNNSQKKIAQEEFAKIADKVIFNKKNHGFAVAVNQGLKVATGDYILLINPDIVIGEKFVAKLIEVLEKNSQLGLIGPRFVFPDGRFQSSFGPFPSLKSELLRFSLLYKLIPGGTFAQETKLKKLNLNKVKIVNWLSGGCLLFKKEILEKLGLFDENYFLGVEDIDFCYRAYLTGYKSLYYPLLKVEHLHGFSSGGTRSTSRIAFDRDGLDYYFAKHFPHKKISRLLIRLLHNLKINFLKKITK